MHPAMLAKLCYNRLMNLQVVLANNLALRLKALNWVAKDLAERADISGQMVYNILRAERWPSAEILQAIAKALNIPASALLTDTTAIAPPKDLVAIGRITPSQAFQALAQELFNAKAGKTETKADLVAEFYALLPTDLSQAEARLLISDLKVILGKRKQQKG